VCHVSLPSSYRSRRGHIHLLRVLPLVGCRSKTPTVVDYFKYVVHPVASTCHAACRVTHRRLLRLALAHRRLLRLRRASGCLGSSRSSSSTTSPPPRVRVPRHVARLVTRLVVDYFNYVARPVASARRAACRVTHRRLLCLAQARCRLLRLRRAFGFLSTTRGSSTTTSTMPSVRLLRHVAQLVSWLIVDYFTSAARPGASARRAARHAARRLLLQLRRASGCFGTSRGLSRDSSSTTSPRAGSSSTTSPTPRVRVPRLVARLVVDYFASAARQGASARRVARHVALRRPLQLRRTSSCFGTSRGLSHDSSSTTSARRVAHRRLLHLRHASGCLGTSHGSSRGSSPTTSTTSRVRLLRHVARLVA
jgi:hypothetical protein